MQLDWKFLIGFFILAVVLGVGAFTSGVVQVPEAGLEDRGDWGEVRDDTIQIRTTGYVNNPNSFGLNIPNSELSYTLNMNGVKMAEGGKKGLNIRSNSNQTIPVKTLLDTEKISVWWARHLKNGERSRIEAPVSLDLNIFSRSVSLNGFSYRDTVETDLESKMDQAASNVEGSYSWSLTDAELTETRLEVVDASAEFGKVTPEKTNLLFDVRVRNPNSYPVPTPQLTGGIDMNGVNVAEWDAKNVEVVNASSDTLIQPGEERGIRVKAVMDNDRVDGWFLTHAANSERTSGNINLKFAFDLAGQRLDFPSSEGISCGFRFRTGILVDNQSSSSSFNRCEYEGNLPGSKGGSSLLPGSSDGVSEGRGEDSAEEQPGGLQSEIGSIL